MRASHPTADRVRVRVSRVQSTYHVVSRATVGEVREVAPPPTRPEGAPEPADLPSVNQEIVKKREERALAKAQAEAPFINENVAMRDQAIFTALSKTMQCEWLETGGEGGGKDGSPPPESVCFCRS